MKAVVVLSVVPEEGGHMRLELSGKWTDGGGPRGDLSAVQILAVLEQAKNALLGGVPFEPPGKVEKVPAQAMKILDAAGNRPN